MELKGSPSPPPSPRSRARRIHSMELKAQAYSFWPPRQVDPWNPFNGIESPHARQCGERLDLQCFKVNPFNGIESRSLSGGSWKCQSSESIQWNWKLKGNKGEREDEVEARNPFNGIESFLSSSLLQSGTMVIGIHSMELKGAPRGPDDAISCDESIQWNWKAILRAIAPSTPWVESIQWNWKIGYFSWKLSIIFSSSESIQWNWKTCWNSYRQPRLGLGWIHSMELKAFEHGYVRVVGEALEESIQWNWKCLQKAGLRLRPLRNPFNGIESPGCRGKAHYGVCGFANPFNGIESFDDAHGITLACSRNPFNGIERSPLHTRMSWSKAPSWIHSMELKAGKTIHVVVVKPR